MEITLNENGWHKKLQKFVFKYPPAFYNFCPYFWLTIFCVIVTFIIPVVPFWKLLCLIGRALIWPLEKMSEGYDKFVCLPFWENIAKKMPDFDILTSWILYTNYNHKFYNEDGSVNQPVYDEYYFWINNSEIGSRLSSKTRDAFLKKFELWKGANADWEAKLMKIREQQKALREQHLKDLAAKRNEILAQEKLDRDRAERSKKRKQQIITAIVKYTKWLAYVLLSVIGIAICYGVYLLVGVIADCIQWGVAHFNYHNFIVTLSTIGVIIVGAGLIYLIVKIIMKCTSNITVVFKDTKIGKFLIAIGQFLVTYLGTFFGAIWKVLCFIGMFIKTTKEDYCPGINWVKKD